MNPLPGRKAPPQTAHAAMSRLLKIAIGSLVVGVTVLTIKLVAYWITGSIGLYSDALESLVNVGAAAAVIVAVWLARKPADANHPYGHTKAEYFSAVVEGALIIIAAASILRESYNGLLDPPVIDEPTVGILVNLGATVINAAWGAFLYRSGKSLSSPALVADSRHLFADVVTSVGVAVGVVIAIVADTPILDPIVAALVALNVLWSGWKLVKESVGGLMDEAAPPDQVERMREIIATYAEGAIEAHDLRTRHAGALTFVDFHLVVAGEMSVTEAHDICDRIERALQAEFDNARITIHVEPENKAKHEGIVVL